MTGSQIIWSIIKIAVMAGVVVNGAALLTWFDRRGGGLMQDRVGPNRAVVKLFGKEFRLAGLLHPLADGVKFFFKEDFMPPKADKFLFSLAPMLTLAPVIALVAVIPFGDTVCPTEISRIIHDNRVWPWVPRFGTCSAGMTESGPVFPVELMVSSLNVGILYVFALAGQGIVAAGIAGWSSDNKFSLLGALRAASQMVSYEVAMGISLVGAMTLYGTVRLDDMVRWQGENTWGIFVQPLAFFIFFAAVVAESKRIPFDCPEAESELVSGFFTEYSGMKFGMFYFAEYMEVVTSSMLLVTIFLGGWQLPFLHRDGLTIEFGKLELLHVAIPHIWMTIIGVLGFFLKLVTVCLLQAFIRWTLPRFRYDQLMKLGWKILLPLSLANVLVTGVVSLAIQGAGAGVSDALDVASDISQAVIAAVLIYGLVRLVIFFFTTRGKTPWIVGSGAKYASATGGTPVTPMQA